MQNFTGSSSHSCDGISLGFMLPIRPAAAADYTLYYTAASQQQPSRRRRLQDPKTPFWLASAAFDDAGAFVERTNITAPMNGMGYLSLSPDGRSMLFASERQVAGEPWSNVDTYTVSLKGEVRNVQQTPRPLFNDSSALLAPCANFTPPCSQVSTFHATFSADGKRVVFAYRAWSSIGGTAESNAPPSDTEPLTICSADSLCFDSRPLLRLPASASRRRLASPCDSGCGWTARAGSHLLRYRCWHAGERHCQAGIAHLTSA